MQFWAAGFGKKMEFSTTCDFCDAGKNTCILSTFSLFFYSLNV